MAVIRIAKAVMLMVGVVISLTLSTSVYSEHNIQIYNEPIQPIPLTINLDKDKVELGRKLFHDPRLSKDNSISCATCHPLEHGGMDNKSFSVGISQEILPVNTPTTLNSVFNFRQTWDGRADSLESQAALPIEAKMEMAGTWPEIIEKLTHDQHYESTFIKTYGPDGISKASITNALAEFERSLITPNSRFDQFLRGNDNVISADEQQGYILFKKFGCASCHQGVNVGGNMYERMGLIRDYFADRGNITERDYGRYNVTGREAHRFQFKVPSLRNIALTAPYFHDGSAETLNDAVATMAKYQLGRRLSDQDIALIVAFLKTLTGELPH